MFRKYYALTKPGIIYGNVMTAAAGFLLASKWRIDWGLLAATLVGTSLVIASACVFNNYIDRGIDAKMARTRKRALVEGSIAAQNALVYAVVLGIVGFMILALYVNALVVVIGAVGIVDYVVLYGITKRRFVAGTIVGSVSGAMPVVAGYCAVTGRFDLGATLLFIILALWQMPHFYAIAMYRHDDYKAAGLPVLPVKKGMRAAKLQIVTYIVAFTVVCALLAVFGYTGFVYLAVTVATGAYWLFSGLRDFGTDNSVRWGRKMFGVSLLVILTLSAALAVGSILP